MKLRINHCGRDQIEIFTYIILFDDVHRGLVAVTIRLQSALGVECGGSSNGYDVVLLGDGHNLKKLWFGIVA